MDLKKKKKIFFNFCKKKKIYFIEDNCHSLINSYLNKNFLPDVTFYSAHKLIKKIYTGGVLEVFNKKGNMEYLFQELKPYEISLLEHLKNFFENNLPKLKYYLKKIIFKIPNYEKIDGIKNKKILNDYKIDNHSLRLLKRIDLKKIKKQRLINYKKWEKFCRKNKNLFFINRKLNKNTTPWLFPIMVKKIGSWVGSFKNYFSEIQKE